MVLQARISSTSTSSSPIPKFFDTRPPEMHSAHKMKKAGPVCQGLPPEMASAVTLRNLTVPKLYEMALLHDAGTKTVANGALAAYSGTYTGRCPGDKRVVKNAESEANIWWGGSSPNIALSDASFLQNRALALDFLSKQERVFVQDGFVNWGPQARTKVRVVCSRAYHALFMRNMMIRPTPEELDDFGEPDFTIFNAGACPANPDVEGVSSNVSVAVNLERSEMVILGTEYAGEMKKGIFTIMHYLMPLRGMVSLHSGSNIGQDGDVTLFFGLSGTGKTTLSADPRRPLIGDDEHCWGDDGVFNIEGGCYAKCINLSQEQEPHIWNAIRFGAVLENVKVDEFDEVDYDDVLITENTRACYPVEHIEHAHIPCVASHPKNIIMLCCDAFGVLPPVARLTSAQAMYHFISGYTAKVAGTEMGITEPQATFSACFGGAFLMWHPMKYAAMLAEKMEKHGTHCWLLNTGWTGGSYGVGSRIKLRYTRAIVDAIHSGELSEAPYSTMPIFNLHVPTQASGVPAEVLQPRCAWANPAEYDAALTQLAQLFNKNMHSFKDGRGYVSEEVAAEILKAGPALPAAPSPPTPTVPLGSCVIAHKVASQTKLSEVDLHGTSPPIGVWTAHGDRVKC